MVLSPLDFFAAPADIGENGIDAALVDNPHPMVRDAQTHPPVFAFHPKPVIVQIRVEQSLGLVVGVGNIVTHNTALAGDLTYSGHRADSYINCADLEKFSLYK
jgi:hypothetical protein